MSASVEIFDVLSPKAREFTRREHRRTGSPVDARSLQAFLDDAVARYRASGGVADLTEGVVQDTLRSISRYCTSMPVRSYSDANRRLFSAMSGKAKAWAKADRRARRAPVDRDRLKSYLDREVASYVLVPGQDVPEADRASVVERLATYFARMGAVKAPPVRPASTRNALGELEVDVRSMEQLEADRALRDGREPRRLTIDTLTDALAVELVRGPDGKPFARSTGVTRSAVRGAVERLHGHPRRAARIDRLPAAARDLVGVLEFELPKKRISVVLVDALAAKLWAPARTPEAKRKHAERLRHAGEAIAQAGVGLRFAVVGSHVVVGRGRVLPTDKAALKALVAAATVVRPQVGRDRVHRLSAGLVPSRQGIWGSEEGEVAKAMCRTVASQGGIDDVYVTLAAAGMTAAADDFDAVYEHEAKTIGGDTLVLAASVERAAETREHGRLSGQAERGIAFVRDLVARARDAGLDQAWGDLVRKGALAERLRRASEASARERVRRIGAVLSRASCPEAWEAVILLSTVGARPGRRHRHPIPMPAPVAAPAPVPEAPKFVPSFVQDARISGDLSYEISAHHRVNRVAKARAALRAIYLGFDPSSIVDHDLDALPQPATADEVRAGLRRILSHWNDAELAPVLALDKELGGVMREAVLDAGLSVRDHGELAVPYALAVAHTVYRHSYSPEAAMGLPRDLKHRSEHFRWALAQKRNG